MRTPMLAVALAGALGMLAAVGSAAPGNGGTPPNGKTPPGLAKKAGTSTTASGAEPTAAAPAQDAAVSPTGSTVTTSSAPTPQIGSSEFNPNLLDAVNRAIPSSQSSAHVPSSHVPRPATLGVTGTGSELGPAFAGLNIVDQHSADNGNQFELEPPDQGLCVGSGTVLETINSVFATYKTSGTMTSGPTSLTEFFTGQPQVVRAPDGTATFYGPLLTDPRCYYDPGLQRFFMTITEIDQDPSTGALGTHSSVLIAVSTSSSPTTSASDWHIYAIDMSNAGGLAVDTEDGARVGSRTLPSHPGCPCVGDQPMIGADEYGFYVTTNEYSILGSEFNGAQVFAFDKAALAEGTLRLQYVAGADKPLPLAEDVAYSLQPATSPTAGDWATADGGTEYLLSTLDFNMTLDDRIAVWALTNTSSLASNEPAVELTSAVLSSEVYGQPPDAVQRSGSTPLATIVQQLFGLKNPNSKSAVKEELVAGNDDRMNQVVYADGHLWGAVNTVVKTGNGPSHVGSAYFVVSPGVGTGGVGGSITSQGYLAVDQANLLFPSIGVTHDGKAVYTATLTGTGYYPSAVYATIDSGSGPGAVHVAAAGAGPDDGYTGYPPNGGPTGRWGDYSAAAADDSGNVWVATEYIGQSCTPAEFLADQTCGGTRTVAANWGTFVARVTP
jgi:hypothetical protein